MQRFCLPPEMPPVEHSYPQQHSSDRNPGNHVSGPSGQTFGYEDRSRIPTSRRSEDSHGTGGSNDQYTSDASSTRSSMTYDSSRSGDDSSGYRQAHNDQYGSESQRSSTSSNSTRGYSYGQRPG